MCVCILDECARPRAAVSTDSLFGVYAYLLCLHMHSKQFHTSTKLYVFVCEKILTIARTQAILRQEIGFFDVTKTGRNSQKSAHCCFIQFKCFRF